MVATACIMLRVGFLFVLMDTWPVIGFCGLEFLLICVMFQLYCHAKRGYKRVRLNDAHFDVQKVNPSESEINWHFDLT
jgi:uncharacterized membrane protein